MISEIAVFEASDPNIDLANPSSKYKVPLEQHLKAVLEAPGAQTAYYAQLIEKPDTVILVVNWDSLDSHVEFTRSSNFPAHVSSFRTHLIKDSGPGTVFHIPFAADPSPALESGVTEIVFAYFHPVPLPAAAKDSIIQSFNHVEPVIQRNGSLTGYLNGWAVEEEGVETPLVGTEGDGEQGEKGKKDKESAAVYMCLVGWKDLDTHAKFMESEDFKENRHWFFEVEGIRGGEIFHARFVRI